MPAFGYPTSQEAIGVILSDECDPSVYICNQSGSLDRVYGR